MYDCFSGRYEIKTKVEVRIILRLAIDPVMNDRTKGSRPPMMPQIISAFFSTTSASSLTCAVGQEQYVDLSGFSWHGKTWEEAIEKARNSLQQMSDYGWVIYLLDETNK